MDAEIGSMRSRIIWCFNKKMNDVTKTGFHRVWQMRLSDLRWYNYAWDDDNTMEMTYKEKKVARNEV